jgi:SCP-2 sterol transfer family protein
VRIRRLLSIAIAAPGIGCSTEAADKCADGAAWCASTSELVVCSKTAKASYPCRGARGCASGAAVACDVTGNAAGEACRAEDAPRCGGARLFRCELGRLKVSECRGPRGCTAGEPPACDQSLAAAGAECEVADSVACSDDRKALLVCREGRFEREASCDGGDGCRLAAGPPQCFGARLDVARFFEKELPRALRNDPKRLAAAMRVTDANQVTPPHKIRILVAERSYLIDVDARDVSATPATGADCTVQLSEAALELLLLRPELAMPLFFGGRLKVEGSEWCKVGLPKLFALRPWPAALLPPTESLSDIPVVR